MHNFKKLLADFFQILKSSKMSLGQILCLAACYIAISSFDLASLGIVLIAVNDFVGVAKDYPNFFPKTKLDGITLLLLLPVIWLIKFIIVLFANYWVVKFSQQTILNVRSQLVTSLFSTNKPLETEGSKEVWLDTINRQLSFASTGIIEPTLRAIFDLVVLFVISSFVALVAPIPFLTTLFWLAIGMLIFDRFVRTPISLNSYRFNKESESLTNDTVKVSEGFKEFWALRTEQFHLFRIMNSARLIGKYYSRFSVLNMSPRLFAEFLIVTGIVCSLVIAEWLQLPREETVASLSVVGFATLRIIPLINSVNLGANQLRGGGRTLENIQSLLKRSNVRDAVHANGKLCSIELKNISKSYENLTLFEDFSVSIKKGFPTAIVGFSGSGKSTLLEIISGLVEPDTGYADALDEYGSQHSITRLGSAIGYVTQKPVIVNGTIYENVYMKNQPADPKTDTHLKQAMSLSGFGKVMRENNLKLSSLVGPNGISLSIGQEQKLAICRALCLSADILVFDEPTSAFDDVSEIDFFSSIAEMSKDKILVVVTHSKKFTNKFEQVIELNASTKSPQVKFNQLR